MIAGTPDASSLGDGSPDSGSTDVEPDAGDTGDYHDVTDPNNWAGVDLAPLFSSQTSFESGACFDGNYIYWGAIVSDEAGWHSALTRYDTRAAFKDLSSWSTWAPNVAGLETRPMVFDGRYVYVGQTGGREVRYDTQSAFGDLKSLTFSTSLPGSLVGKDAGPYSVAATPSATFDGRYVYFASVVLLGNGQSVTLRFDTQADFQTPAAWSASPAQATGWWPAIFVAPYVVLRPKPGEPTISTVVYDTTQPFESGGSWSSFSLQSIVGNEMFSGAGSAKGNVYYVPYGYGPTQNGLVARHDTTAPLSDPKSWQTFQTTKVNALAKGFDHASWDGRYFYFMVGSETGGNNGAVVARYDTTQAFESAASWSAFDMTPLLPTAVQLWGGGVVFDGEYIYIAAHDEPTVMRFLARTPRKLPMGFSGSFY
jgi:hypothetical protein